MEYKKRIVEVKNADGWKRILMPEVRKGNIIRMFDDDTPVKGLDGRTEFEADDDAFLTEDGKWGIHTDMGDS